jgi:hypothetical protein
MVSSRAIHHKDFGEDLDDIKRWRRMNGSNSNIDKHEEVAVETKTLAVVDFGVHF